ncbi:MAG: hypothetical protein HWE07_11450 [Cytophagia bacterium]|nr:hypothetical protein [Cytophagia bacterium]
MASYYVYCEKHGKISDSLNSPGKASLKRKAHMKEVSAPHGKVSIIEESRTNKYGQEIIHLKKYRG